MGWRLGLKFVNSSWSLLDLQSSWTRIWLSDGNIVITLVW